MKKNRTQIYMKMDTIKKISGRASSKKRSMNFLSRILFMIMSGKFIMGLLIIAAVAGLVNENIRKQEVESKCWFCMAGGTSEAKGIVTKVEFIKLGFKKMHNYKVFYTYTVNGISYNSVSYQTGLTYRIKDAIDVTYSLREPSCSCGSGIKCPAEDAMFTLFFGGVFVVIALFLIISGIKRILNAIWVIEYGTLASSTVKKIIKTDKRTIFQLRSFYTKSWAVTCWFEDSSGKKFSLEIYSSSKDSIKKDDTVEIIYDPGMPENAFAIDTIPKFVKTDPVLSV